MASNEESGLLNDVPRPSRPTSTSAGSRSSVDSEASSADEEKTSLRGAVSEGAPRASTGAEATVPPVSGDGTRNALTVHDARCTGMSPAARFGSKTVVRRDTHLYVYGGAQSDVAAQSVLADAQVYRLNIATMQWRPLDDQGTNCGGGRFGHTLTLVSRDAMILHGGVCHGRVPRVAAEDSSSQESTTTSSNASSRSARWRPQSLRQQMFLDNVPGLALCDEDSLWLLNVVDRTTEQGLERAIWSRLEEKPGAAHPSGRMHHSATFVPALQSLVIFGGTRPGEALNDLWMLNTSTMEWTEPVTTGAPPSARFGHTATLPLSPAERLDSLDNAVNAVSGVEVDGDEEDLYGRTREKKTIMFMGGFTTAFSGRVSLVDGYTTGTVLHLLDLAAMTWSSPQCFGSIPPPMGFHTANMTSGDSHLLVFGGETQMSLTLGHGGGAAFVFDRLRWVWSRPQFNSSDFEPPSLHATANVMNKPVIFGGVVRRARLPNGKRIGTRGASGGSGGGKKSDRPRVEVSDKLRLFNTVVLSQLNKDRGGGKRKSGDGDNDTDDDDEKVKLIIVGDSGVGKSNLLMRFADDHFETNSQTTIGVDFKSCITGVGGQRVRLLCWDTAGQERYRTITSNYYRGADACLFVYDSTRMETAQNLPKWFDAVREHCGDDMPCLIVANKADKVAEEEMQRDENADDEGGGGRQDDVNGLLRKGSRMGKIRALAVSLATEKKIPLMETSARTSEGVDAVFLTIAARYLAYRNSAQGRSARRAKRAGKNKGGIVRDAGGRGIQPSKLGSHRRKKNGCC